MFSTFLLNKLSHYRDFYKTETEFIEHLISGEVTIPIKDILNYVDEYHSQLPSNVQVRQVVAVKFKDEVLTGTVVGVHFYTGKVKYDVSLWLMDEKNEEYETRIYNVDSLFVSPK